MFTYPKVPRCHYIKTNGTRCGSPALRNQRLCYFHQRWHQQRISLRAYPDEQNHVELPVLEDANSIQMALTHVMRLVLNEKISHKQAGLLLYALQIASANLRHTNFDIGDERTVVIDPATLAEAGVGVNSWNPADFPSPLDPAPDAASEFTPDLAQPVYGAGKKVQSAPQPAIIPELKAQAEVATRWKEEINTLPSFKPRTRLLASRGTPWRHSRIPLRCDTGKPCRSGDHKRRRRRAF